MAPTNASAATEPMDGKEKPSRNLDMEGQRVRTTKPPRNTRTTAALAQRIVEESRRPKPKEVTHNNCPYDCTAKEETVQKEAKVSTNSQPPVRTTESRDKETHSQRSQKPKVPGPNNVVRAKLEQQRQGRERDHPPPPPTKRRKDPEHRTATSQTQATTNVQRRNSGVGEQRNMERQADKMTSGRRPDTQEAQQKRDCSEAHRIL